MKHLRFMDKQAIGILKKQENSLETVDVRRKHSISGAPFYKYMAKFGGMKVSGARKLKAGEYENAKLKKLLGETIPLVG